METNRHGMVSKNFVFTMNKLRNLQFEMVKHRPYSLHLALPVYFLFVKLKTDLKDHIGSCFANQEKCVYSGDDILIDYHSKGNPITGEYYPAFLDKVRGKIVKNKRRMVS